MTDLEDLPGPEWPIDLTVSVAEIGVDGENPNEMGDDQFSTLISSIREDGWLQPILVKPAPKDSEAEYLIADGEHRWRAAKDELGLERVPALIGEDWSEAQRRLVRQRMNKVHGEHDMKRDALEYDWLADHGKRDEVLELLDARDETLDEYLTVLQTESPVTQNREYSVDHNVYFEDCVDGMAERLEDDSVDIVITDPPYGVGFHNQRDEFDPAWRKGDRVKGWGGIEGDQTLDEAITLLRETLSEVTRALVEDGHTYIFCDWRAIDRVKPLVEEYLTVKNLLVWDKGSMGIGDLKNNWGYSHEFILFATNSDRAHELAEPNRNVLEHRRKSRETYEHPTEKPVSLMDEIIRTATRPGDRILDPFMGSGTTAVAAIQNERDYVGFEVDEENYREVIDRRIHDTKRQMNASASETTSDGQAEGEEAES